MKRRPRITKESGQWRIERDGYGFNRPESLGPFRSHAAACTRLAALVPGSAAAQVERTRTPEQYWPPTLWPLIVQRADHPKCRLPEPDLRTTL
ncbi:hypothetical protein [Amycolatopsis sp. H20-H5]|uniref:hypothetical protein n=1 Tax=Amycolatopsis sp. H20-H5 TaxID=3046309 RepID=UPI002DB6EC95|nr:hypothetical protein [Amycolatopsis sp. H20-H5]MEC3977882.1 hypothetical protein [Amycolatopsis sp. H20-H5]